MKPPVLGRPTAGSHRVLLGVLERLGILVVFGGSLLAAWWGVQRLLRHQGETAALSRQVSKLSTDVELMEGQCAPSRTRDAALRFDEARQDLFDGGGALLAWRDAVRDEAVPLALDAEVTFRGTRTNAVGGEVITLIQATIDLLPAAGVPATRSVYHRVLDLTHRLTTQDRRVDLLSLRLEGAGSNSVRQASAEVELWAMDRKEGRP